MAISCPVSAATAVLLQGLPQQHHEHNTGRAECKSSVSGRLAVAGCGVPMHVCGNAAPSYATPWATHWPATILITYCLSELPQAHQNTSL